ncbi:MAG: 50S ribosomal protein L24 [Candidatus Nealsonbacteria bacterium]|nr:50S ribosomal protein L24 [Candidatus Nealsonbacteria bacterium]
MNIKKGDTVLIISGKDRGRTGKVIKAFPKERKVSVEGVNVRKKHVRAKKSGEKGQIIQIPGFLHLSSIKIICKNCKRPTRLSFKIIEGKKYRICKKCGQEI